MREGFSVDMIFHEGYATFGQRLWAAFLDYLFLSLIFKVMRMLFSPSQVNPALFAFIAVSYFVLMIGISGQTLGKWAMGIKVIDEDGNPPGILTSVLRTVGYLISLIFFMGFLWIRMDREYRGWHDLIAGTKVVLV